MRAFVLVVVALLGRTARAELMDPIPVRSVTATGSANKALWKIVAGDGEGAGAGWCQDTLSSTAKLTIELTGEPILSDITLTVDGGITNAEVVADGVPISGEVDAGQLALPLKTVPIGELVVTVSGKGRGCVKHVELTLGPTIYSSNSGATLWHDITAARRALVACDQQQLAKTFAFPFTVTWPETDQNGMTGAHTTYTSAAKLAAGCHNAHVAPAAIKLDTQPKVRSTSLTTLTVDDGAIRWELVLQNKHWRVKAFAFPGA